MYSIDYNPESRHWKEVYASLPKEMVEQIEAPIGIDEGLKILKRSRKPINVGDVFVCSINGKVYYYGKVLETIQRPNEKDWYHGCHVVVIFKCKTDKMDMEKFQPDYDNLLMRPDVVSRYYWTSGRFQTIGNVPLTDQEKNLDYGIFKSYNIKPGGTFEKIDGTPMEYMPQYSFTGILTDIGVYLMLRRETIIDPTLLEL